MSKRILSVLAFVTLTGAARAEDINPNEKPDTVMYNLSPYSIGLGTGAIFAVNTALSQESEAFLKLSLAQAILFGSHWQMGLDLDWNIPGQNWGGDLTVDYLLAKAPFRPFIGLGGGIRYFDKEGSDFGKNLGPSFTGHIGILFDVLDEMQMRLRLPYTVVANASRDVTAGLDVAILFSNPLRGKRVKKLVYD